MADTSGRVSLSRQELYQQVWSTPMSRLSPQYGLSGSGLGKICKQHGIPRPPRGHWSRLRHGKEVGVKPLPVLDDERLATVVIDPHAPVRAAVKRTGDVGDTEAEAEGHAKPVEILVPETLGDPHPLVAATSKSLLGREPDKYGLVWSRAENVLDVQCSPRNLPRAMRIMNALIVALEDRGASVDVSNAREQHGTRAVIDGEKIPFSLREEVRQSEVELTVEDKHRKKQGLMLWGPRYDFTPTGTLALAIETHAEAYAQRRWSDGKRRALEARLGDFLAALPRFAEHLRVERQKREAQEKQRREERHQEEARQRLIEEEKRHLDGLLHEVDRWHRSQQIRAFVKDVIDRHEKANGPIEAGSQLHQWIQWATHHADRFDPLADGPPSILDGQH